MSKLEASVFKRNFVTVIWLGISVTVIPLTCIAADSEQPELNGTWTNQSITRLNRSEDVPLLVTIEQAQRRAAVATFMNAHQNPAAGARAHRIGASLAFKTPTSH